MIGKTFVDSARCSFSLPELDSSDLLKPPLPYSLVLHWVSYLQSLAAFPLLTQAVITAVGFHSSHVAALRAGIFPLSGTSRM